MAVVVLNCILGLSLYVLRLNGSRIDHTLTIYHGIIILKHHSYEMLKQSNRKEQLEKLKILYLNVSYPTPFSFVELKTIPSLWLIPLLFTIATNVIQYLGVTLSK